MPDENKPKKIIKMFDISPPPRTREFVAKEEMPEEEKIEAEAEEIKVEEAEPIQEAAFETPEEHIFPEGLIIEEKPKKKKKKIAIIAGVFGVAALGLVCYFSLSKAEIIIKPKTETMQFKTDLSIDKNAAFIDLDNNKIPAQFFQVEKEEQKEFPATREKEVQEKAKGTITVYNQYSSAPQTLVKGTRFISDKEKLFRTVETIVIPGAQIEEGKIIPNSIDVSVEAAEPGKDYNIGPTSFTIPGFKGTPKYDGFYGKSTQSMSGGVIGRVKVVTAEDIQAAKDILAIGLKKKVKEELEKKTPSDLNILKDTSTEEIVESSSSIEANQAADKFIVKVKVIAKVLGFSENDAISLINDNLKEKISENKTLVKESITINYTVTDINLDKGTAKLSCEVKEDLAWKIDVEQIRNDLLGKDEMGVRQYLASRLEIESAKVIFWPFWVNKIPSKASKIKITID